MEICNDKLKFARCAALGFRDDPAFSKALQGQNDKEKILQNYFLKYFTECAGLKLYQTSAKQEGFLCYYIAGQIDDIELSPDMSPFQILDKHYQSGFAVLDVMCVAPQFRGRGFADTMIGFFLSECQKRGLTPLVEIFDTEHIKMYQKHGFAVTHRSEFQDITTVVMEKK